MSLVVLHTSVLCFPKICKNAVLVAYSLIEKKNNCELTDFRTSVVVEGSQLVLQSVFRINLPVRPNRFVIYQIQSYVNIIV